MVIAESNLIVLPEVSPQPDSSVQESQWLVVVCVSGHSEIISTNVFLFKVFVFSKRHVTKISLGLLK